MRNGSENTKKVVHGVTRCTSKERDVVLKTQGKEGKVRKAWIERMKVFMRGGIE